MDTIGIIGGSGLYELPGLQDARWVRCDTPWGAPSDELLRGRLGDVELVFLARHGRGHRIPPDEVNYRANLHALKAQGVSSVLSVSAVGSLREDLPPGSFVIVDQFVDRTAGRPSSFFGTGLVAHVSMAKPVCGRLQAHLQRSLQALQVPHWCGGTYLAMQGPQFSTRAESELYRQWGCDVIGMTNLPEARLAREAELCYASLAMVTDYDCWHPGHDAVTVDVILAVLQANARQAQSVVAHLADHLGHDPHGAHCACRRSLDHALITAPSARDPAMVDKLSVVAGRVLGR